MASVTSVFGRLARRPKYIRAIRKPVEILLYFGRLARRPKNAREICEAPMAKRRWPIGLAVAACQRLGSARCEALGASATKEEEEKKKRRKGRGGGEEEEQRRRAGGAEEKRRRRREGSDRVRFHHHSSPRLCSFTYWFACDNVISPSYPIN